MNEIQAINMARDTDFLKRIAFSLSKNARTIHAETAGPRTVLAKAVIMAPDAYAAPFAFAILSSLSGAQLAAISQPSDVSQSSIDAQVATCWDAFT